MKYADFRPLETPRLRLRRLTMEDVPVYFSRIGSSRRVTEHMLWQPHKDISESAASIQKVLRRYEDGNCYRWGIALKSDESLIGIIELLRFDEQENGCSFAYMLGEDFWGQGYGTEALKAVFAFAFTHMQVEGITADHFAANPASGAVMRKAGMGFVRYLPQKYEKNGTRIDAVEYRITKEDWEKNPRR